MNKLKKALALILSLAAILCFPISASALSDEALPTIDYARTGSNMTSPWQRKTVSETAPTFRPVSGMKPVSSPYSAIRR